MPATGPNQWRQGDPIEDDKATSGQSRQAGKCLMVRIEDHSSSSGSLEWPVRAESSIAQGKPMELLAFLGV
jgi:hypothetical protein